MLKNKFLVKVVVFFLLVSFNASFAQAIDYSNLQRQAGTLQQMQKDGLQKSADKTAEELMQSTFEKQDEISQQGDKYNKQKEAKLREKKLSKLEKDFSQVVSEEGFVELKQFGYDIFEKGAPKIYPDENIPVDSDYIVGPGDSFNVTMWGISEGVFKVTVNQNGEIALPKVGIISVAGLTYGGLESFIKSQLNRYYEGISVGITVDKIKGVRVYVVGDVKNPGSYSLSSLSTAYGALFYAGGPTKNGTLRNIKIIKNGKTISTLDLYKFLLKGDTSGDRPLQSGDTVFVPVIGDVAAVAGNVKRPAIYEIKGNADLADVLSLAGGVDSSSYLNRIQIERVVAHQQKIIFDENISFLEKQNNLGISIQDMDLIKVFPIFSKVSNKIFLKGDIKYPGTYEYKPGMKLSDILTEDILIKPIHYPRIEVIRMVEEKDIRTVIYNIDYTKLFIEHDLSHNMELQSGDQVYVFASQKEQETVKIKGEVKLPGAYAIQAGERISSLIERAGGYTVSAYLFGAVLKRKNVKDLQESSFKKLVQQLEIDLMRKERELSSGFLSQEDIALRKSNYQSSREIITYLKASAMEGRVIIGLDELKKLKGSKDDIELEADDELIIPKTPKSIVALGSVFSPNAIAYDPNLRVRDYLSRVGGVTENADKSNVYVLRADGSVASQKQRYDVFALKLNPGDSILVPEKLESISFWGIMKEMTHWLYEAAVSVAVLRTVIQ